ncbi:MAG: DUF3383 family protein [Deltaproteobacteria bacterium]|nr:DUF3383 family protein [Deltaproteobacteria bacterium]
MSGLSDVDIVITRETQPLTQAGFGLPLIVSFTDAGGIDYTLCSDTAAVEDAGFAPTTGVYKMAQAVFAQSPCPQQVAVAELVKKAVNATAVIESADGGKIEIEATGTLGGTAGNDLTVEVTNNTETGTEALDVSYDAGVLTIELDQGTHTAADIVTAINALADWSASRLASGSFGPGDVQSTTTSGGMDASITGALNELIKTNSDWYFLLSPERGEAAIKEIAAWVQANKKLYVTCPDGTVNDVITYATDIAGDRTALIYHDDPSQYPDAAWVGRCAPENPGSITWKFKTLQGITPANVSTTDITNLHSANANTYVQKLGVNQTSEGLTTGNEYIDIIRGQDWVEARMSEAIHRLLFTSPKIPYDNRGIAMVVSTIQAVLQYATDREIIARDSDGNGMWSVTAPDRSEILTNYIANRILPDVEFEFVAAGAIHKVQIRGVITL